MSENGKFYVYIHRRKTDYQPFYVGKGMGRRAWETSSKRRNRHWINVAQKHGVYVEIYKDGISESEAFEIEIALIAEMKSLGIELANKTDGGEGSSGAKLSKSHQEALLKALAGHKFNVGRKHSDQARQNMSAATKKYYETNEHPWTGKSHSPMTKELIASKLRGRQFSDETKEKMRQSRIGKTMPDDVKEKIRQKNSGENAHFYGVKGKDHPAYGLTGSKNPTSKPIRCIELDIVFESSNLAAKYLRNNDKPKASHQPILASLNKPNRTAYGYHWESV